jgi:hypothetical protein
MTTATAGYQGSSLAEILNCDLIFTINVRNKSEFYMHLAETHLKAYLFQQLRYVPGKPVLKCPEPDCEFKQDRNPTIRRMIRHYGLVHNKVREAIGSKIVGRYVPESEMLNETYPGQQQEDGGASLCSKYSKFSSKLPSVPSVP